MKTYEKNPRPKNTHWGKLARSGTNNGVDWELDFKLTVRELHVWFPRGLQKRQAVTNYKGSTSQKGKFVNGPSLP